MRDAASRAARVIAVSATVAAAAAAAGIDRSRIVVVHEGVPEAFRIRPSEPTIGAVCSRYGVEPGGYVIFVGAVTERKNIATVLQALSRVSDAPRLLIAGAMGFGSEPVREAIERMGSSGRVASPGFVPDADLPALIAGAVALVHPSEYEGFGLTPLEAMSLGTPAIASRAGALPEILGDAAVLLEPRDVDAWAEAIARVRADQRWSATLAATGRAHAARFTWRRAAEETAAVHETVVRARA